jgi:hypothetical protein
MLSKKQIKMLESIPGFDAFMKEGLQKLSAKKPHFNPFTPVRLLKNLTSHMCDFVIVEFDGSKEDLARWDEAECIGPLCLCDEELRPGVRRIVFFDRDGDASKFFATHKTIPIYDGSGDMDTDAPEEMLEVRLVQGYAWDDINEVYLEVASLKHNPHNFVVDTDVVGGYIVCNCSPEGLAEMILKLKKEEPFSH